MRSSTPINCPPRLLPYEQAVSVYHAVGAQAFGLPFHQLTPAQRQALAGALLPDTPVIVDFVCDALEKDRHLFPDVPVSLQGQGLRAVQGCADGWRILSQLFLTLGAWAADTHLHYQAEASSQARSALQQVKAAAELPFSQNKSWHAERLNALMPAYLLVDHYYKSLQKIKTKRKKEREATQEPRPKKEKSPQKRTSEKLRKEKVGTEILEEFQGAVRDIRARSKPEPPPHLQIPEMPEMPEIPAGAAMPGADPAPTDLLLTVRQRR